MPARFLQNRRDRSVSRPAARNQEEQQQQRVRAGLCSVLVVCALLGCLASAPARAADVAATGLPGPARATLLLIRHGGPFPYAKDGIVFGNYEHLLPREPRGFYHEYTVPTGHGRGANRIVCGGPIAAPDLCYYSHDHYASFQRIAG